MPWQGDLFIGQTVKTKDEALTVYKKLRIELGETRQTLDGTIIEPDVFDGTGKEFLVTFNGRLLPVYIYAMMECETDTSAVAFNLTGRYKGRVLDVDCKHDDGRLAGRSDPFVFDPQDIVDILAQVRTWWPEAQVFIWDRFH